MDSPNSGNVDEAQEKLFGESNSSGSKIEIKFITDPKNGDTKIDISEVKQVFVGMGKDELMQFANNPFWVRMRWFLFIAFWSLFFGMLAGAIAIILLAPKCSAPVQNKWYQESPMYHLNVKDFKDSNSDGIGDLPGLESKLEYFKDLGVESILLDPIMKTADGTDDVVDFQSINPNYGTFDDLKKLVASAKEKGLHLLMKIVPNFSSDQHEWFNKSIAGVDPFKDYYVWTDPGRPGQGDSGREVPINNWLSVNGQSAWTYNPVRKQFYLHKFSSNQPDLNFRNTEVVKYFEQVYKFWLDRGFEGLYLDKVEHLVEDSKFQNENAAGNIGKIHDEYDFQTHSHTTHLQESWNILSEWSKIFKKHSAVFAVNGVPDLKEADIIFRPMTIEKSIKPGALESMLLKRLNKTSQAWEFSCIGCDERLRISLQAVLLMLPGASVLPSGLELGLPPSSTIQWESHTGNLDTTSDGLEKLSSDPENKTVFAEEHKSGSYFNFFKKILKERLDPSILLGTTDLKHQKSIIAFKREKAGSQRYLVLLNLEDTNQTLDLQQFFGNDFIKLTLINSLGKSHLKDNEPSSQFPNDGSMKLDVPGSSFAVYKVIPGSQ